jgi:putative holliday junction resolvase
MARILAIDYGTKRVGLAVTDENKIIARALDTVHSKDVIKYLADYLSKENVERFVVGHPRQMSGEDSEIKPELDKFIVQLQKAFPQTPIERHDERFTSKMAVQALLEMGLKKKDRQKKEIVDMTSAVIILQSYMDKK